MRTIHHPNGDMCKVCVHKLRKCNHLKFNEMKRMGKYEENGINYIIVKCIEFVKEK